MDTEMFFIQSLGYGMNTWKAQKTRVANKLGLTLNATLTESNIFDILTYVANSSSKSKEDAKKLLKLFEGKEVKSDKAEFVNGTDDLVLSLCSKYNVDAEDFTSKWGVVTKAKEGIEKAIQTRKACYKFPYHVELIKAIEEYYNKLHSLKIV